MKTKNLFVLSALLFNSSAGVAPATVSYAADLNQGASGSPPGQNQRNLTAVPFTGPSQRSLPESLNVFPASGRNLQS